MKSDNFEYIPLTNEDIPSFSVIPEWAITHIQDINNDLLSCNDRKRSDLLESLTGYYLLLGELRKAQETYEMAISYNAELPCFEDAILDQLPPILELITEKGDQTEKLQAAAFSATLLLLIFEDYISYEEIIDRFLYKCHSIVSNDLSKDNNIILTDAIKRFVLDDCWIDDNNVLASVFELLLIIYQQKICNAYTRDGVKAAIYLSRVYDLTIVDFDIILDQLVDSESESLAVEKTKTAKLEAQLEKQKADFERQKAEEERNRLNYFAHNIKSGIIGLKASVDFVEKYLSKKFDLTNDQKILDRFLLIKNHLTLTTELMDGYKLLTQDPEKLSRSIECDSIELNLTMINALEKALMSAFAENAYNKSLLSYLSGGSVMKLNANFFEEFGFIDGSLCDWIKNNFPYLDISICGEDENLGWVSYTLLFSVFSETIKNAFKHGLFCGASTHLNIVLNMNTQHIEFRCENPVSVIKQESIITGTSGGTFFVKKIIEMADGVIKKSAIQGETFICHFAINRNFLSTGRSK